MTPQRIQPNHVAILVPSVRKAADYLRQFNFQIGKEEVWDGEGTKEIYIERDKSNSLLLMEPIKPGAYQRALEKRGPGLHHLAIDVLNMDSFIESITGSGWLLHPASLKTMKQSQTAYLAKPGFPGLIEVQQRDELLERPLFISEINVSLNEKSESLLTAIGLTQIVKNDSSPPSLLLGDHRIELKRLF
jgi:hypothetical protein